MKFHPVKKTDALPSCLKLRMLALDGTVQWRFFFRLTIHHSTDCSLKSSNAPLTCRPDGSHLVSKPWVHIFLYWYNRQRWKRDAVWISFLICCRSDLFEVPCIWKSFFFCIFMIQQSCVLENMSYFNDSLLMHHCNILIQHIQKYYSRFYC